MNKYQTLEHYFGYKTFRRGQEKIIDAILNGDDVLGIMPTGAGKSICYQIPALMLDGITIVISPLISLMKDQVSSLIQSGINAAFINSTLTQRQTELALTRAANGFYKIIYVAPERLETSAFMRFASSANISMVVVDEAHCVSQWGQNFRPSYLHISEFIKALPHRPIAAAFTATATDKVRDDIVELIGLNSPKITTTGFDRPNLYFEVTKPVDKMAALTSYLMLNRGKSGIVYCSTRKQVDDVYETLSIEGWNAGKYHAGMTDSERDSMQEAFIRDEINIMVATNAFGMGIDKSNVAFVVHYNMPKNMESYYQEAGRAGRDGQPAECVLFYNYKDVTINQFLIEKSFEDNPDFDEETAENLKNNELELLKQMTFYSTSKYCLRRFMLRYFGEHPEFQNCGSCSNCTQPHTDVEARDITLEAQKILSCIKRMGERQTKWVIIDILRGSENNRVQLCGGNRQSTFGIMKDCGSRELGLMIDSLIADKYISEAEDGSLGWGMNARGVIYSGMRVTIKALRLSEAQPTASDESNITYDIDSELFSRLKALRTKVADINGVPPFVIFSDATLRDMCAKMPTNEAQFQTVYGVGRVKTEKFGRRFIDEIQHYCDESGAAPKTSEPIDNKKKELKPKKPKKPKYEKAANQPDIHLKKSDNGDYILPDEVDKDLFTALRELRADLAFDYGVQTSNFANIDALAQISADMPATLAELRRMGILPPQTEAVCGQAFVNAVREHLKQIGRIPDEPSDCIINIDKALLKKLKALRKKISSSIYTPQNRIMSDYTLEKMSEIKPIMRSQLLENIYLGNSKCLIFGRIFLEEIRAYAGIGDNIFNGFEGAPEIDRGLFIKLAELRHSLAKKQEKPDLSVFSDYTLYDLCVKLPQNEEDLKAVYGIGDVKCRLYSGELIGCIKRNMKKGG